MSLWRSRAKSQNRSTGSRGSFFSPTLASPGRWCSPPLPICANYDRETYTAHIDLKPALTPEQLEARMVRDLAEYANRDLSNYILTLVPRLLGPVVLERSGVQGNVKLHSLTRKPAALWPKR